MISGGNRKPANAELGTTASGRERGKIIPHPHRPTHSAPMQECRAAPAGALSTCAARERWVLHSAAFGGFAALESGNFEREGFDECWIGDVHDVVELIGVVTEVV